MLVVGLPSADKLMLASNIAAALVATRQAIDTDPFLSHVFLR
jgi:hypothetical protein